MISRAQTAIYREERVWFYGALSCVCVTVGLYMYFVSASVVHVVMRKELDSEITQLHTVVGELETAYIEAQHAVSADIASMQGFTKTDDKIFIDITPPPVALLDN